MTKRKQPATPEELEKDIEKHPERGQLNGEEVIRFDSVELRGQIPREMYRRFLEIAGAQGMTKGQALLTAIASWVSQPGNQALLDHFLSLQSEKHGKSRVEIRSKIFGAYKKTARLRRRNLGTGEEE